MLERQKTRTTEQLLASSCDRHLTVTANAGSGKTTVLVDRIINILLNDANIGNDDLYYTRGVSAFRTVAITFTKKAASEIQAKVVNAITEMILHEKNRPKLEFLYRIRQSLTYSRISTIHSFCAQLLRDYPIEAGISPTFVELTDSDTVSLKKNAFYDTIYGWLGESTSEKPQSIRALLLQFGKKEFEQVTMAILNKCGSLSFFSKIYSLDNLEILRLRNEMLIERVSYHNKIVFDFCVLLLKNSDEYLIKPGKTHDKVKQWLVELRSYLSRNAKLELDIDYFDVDEIRVYIQDLLGALLPFFTKDYRLTSDARKALVVPFDEAQINCVTDSLKTLVMLNDSLAQASIDVEMLDDARILFDFIKDVKLNFDSKKAEIEGLEFNDLIEKAVLLLQDEEICAKARSGIDFLLIDEFQDTDPLQYEIVKRLAPELVVREFSPSMNLFIVGDAKQSIYAFRNADVRVFNQARTDISSYNKSLIAKGLLNASKIFCGDTEIDCSARQAAGELKLTVSFRLQPVIAAFANYIFKRIMEEKNSEFDVDYESFVCGKNVAEIIENKNSDHFSADDSFGSVNLVINFANKTESPDATLENDDEEANPNEALLVAMTIKNIVSEGKYEINGEDGQKKPSFKDIAVLARKRNSLTKLSEAMMELGIPHVVHSKGSFFESIEINDLIAFLNFLNNPDDDIALITVLRSPFADIDISTIFQISIGKQNESMWQKLLNFCSNEEPRMPLELFSSGIPSESTSKIRVFALKAKNIINKKSISSIPSLINSILDDYHYWGKIAARHDFQRAEANIIRFIEIARNYEARGFRTLDGFIDEINNLAEKALSDSPDSYQETSEDAVNLLTIHAAKGLEFPIVFLFDSCSKSGVNQKYNFSEKFGIAFKYKKYSIENHPLEQSSPIHYLSKQSDAAASAAEDKRLLYVALTRASDHLFISGTINKKEKDGLPTYISISKNSMLYSIMQGLDVMPEMLDNSASIDIEEELPLYSNAEIKKRLIQFKLKIIKSQSDNFINSKSIKELQKAEPFFLLDYIDTSFVNEIFTATKYTTYDKSKERFAREFILGLHSLDDDNYEAPVDADYRESDNVGGTLLGTIIHFVLENFRKWLTEKNEVDEELIRALIAEAGYPHGLMLDEKSIGRIIRECHSISQTKLLKMLNNSGIEIETETEYIIPFGDDFIMGKFDLLYKPENSDWEVWDWKTNIISSKAEMFQLASQYDIQMITYAFILSKIKPKQNTYKSRILFTRLAFENAENDDWGYVFEFNRKQLADFENELFSKNLEIKTFY